jgi:two-component system chemotaxis sensor kinase CheA
MRPPEELRGDLLDDFYAECDELLAALRGGLTQLEKAGNDFTSDPEILARLFRSTHSLKGNAAIVGLRAAEEVAHAMEDVFRSLGKRETDMDETKLEVLLAAAEQLEKIVRSHRSKKPSPENPALLGRLRQLLPAHPDVSTPPPVAASAATRETAAKPDFLPAARKRGLHVFRVSFAPSKALDARGVNVKSVRERLGELGEILSAVPSVRKEGQIVFEFVAGFRQAPDDLASWEADGIRLAPAVEEAAASPTPSGTDLSGALSLAPSHLVRVDLARLDELMRITSEMVIQRSRLEDRLQQNGNAYAGLRDINLGLSRSLRDMRAAITRARMVPIAEIFDRMPFVVRDLASGSGKKVRVALEGEQTEVDKYLVERLKEPLLHLVRNAIAHGIETTAERTAAGKPAEATIALRAKSAGETVVIQIRDDGRGVDSAAVIARASRLGLKVPATADMNGILKILCTAGFSTRDEADRAAGRGVGMSVVANVVRELGGILTLET